MSINQRLDIRQGQTLTMTPQLQQAIKLLQMSNIELAEYLDAEIEKNPLLEKDDGTQPPAADTLEAEESARPGDGEILTAHGAEQNDAFAADRAAADDRPLDADFGNVFTGSDMAPQEGGYDAFATDSFAGVGSGGSLKFDDPDYSLENTMAREATLRDHLEEQIQLEFDNAGDRAIARVLGDYLDEAGYIRTDLPALAERLGTGLARVERVLDVLQRLDPAGLFARSLSECLALQLRERDRLDPAMEKLLQNLDLLGAHDLKKLRTACEVDEEDLRDMIAEIRTLNPKPGLAFDRFVSQTVVPDVLMKPLPKSRGGGWAVELNSDTLPRVLVNRTYYAEITRSAAGRKDKEYLSAQISSANWLVRALEQRAETILKVATDIIVQQEAFFLYGVEYLKPLVLKDVAAAIGMHESTVSRVTTGKYIGTPRGVFELKYFFTSGVVSTDGNATWSSEAIKARIRTLVDGEKAGDILSDDDLTAALRAEGIDIARRTVAKYREAMKIPSSVQRRRLKSR